ncbi:MAG: nucleotidyl transferase AbiEii/AbiGii toxin family protein [bacterium]
MLLSNDYYLNKLYPLQDDVLRAVASCTTDFYLTGGTALGRFFLQHRYSDDIDFFVNTSNTFREQTEEVLSAFQQHALTATIIIKTADFIRVQCSKNTVELKVDFVNDIPYRFGLPEKFDLFPRVDNWWNILTNKLTALDRREPKDIADILYICRSRSFTWASALEEGEKKTSYLDPIDLSLVLSEFPIEYLAKVHWVSDISFQDAFNDLQRIAKDIAQKRENSLSHA